jgi:hypothetical protein
MQNVKRSGITLGGDNERLASSWISISTVPIVPMFHSGVYLCHSLKRNGL